MSNDSYKNWVKILIFFLNTYLKVLRPTGVPLCPVPDRRGAEGAVWETNNPEPTSDATAGRC